MPVLGALRKFEKPAQLDIPSTHRILRNHSRLASWTNGKFVRDNDTNFIKKGIYDALLSIYLLVIKAKLSSESMGFRGTQFFALIFQHDGRR